MTRPCPCGADVKGDGLGDPGHPSCTLADAGYPWCFACQDHHRVWPECPGVTPDGEDAGGAIRVPFLIYDGAPS